MFLSNIPLTDTKSFLNSSVSAKMKIDASGFSFFGLMSYRMSHFQQSSCNSRNKNRLVFNSSCSYHLHIIFLSHSVLGLGLELEPEDFDCIVFSFVGLSTGVLPPLSPDSLSFPLIVYDVA